MMRAGDGHLAEELRAGRPVVTPTRGTSMEPLLYQDRTLAVLMPLSGAPKRGDVVLYRDGDGSFVLHRIVSVRNGICCIRGDHCYYQEDVPADRLLGVMTEVVRGGRTIRVTDFSYRLYTAFWLANYPVRALFHRFPVRKWPYYFTHLPALLHKKISRHRDRS